jgi:hypothetical protein
MRVLGRLGFREQGEPELLPFCPEDLPLQGGPLRA